MTRRVLPARGSRLGRYRSRRATGPGFRLRATGWRYVRLMKLIVLYDNRALPGFEAGWGLAVLIVGGPRTVLFDVGWDGDLLLRNMGRLEIDPGSIDDIVLSHPHWDHIGGLPQVLHQGARVHVPSSFSPALRREIATRAQLEVCGEPRHICAGVSTTGTHDLEQALLLDVGGGQVVLSGCAHPGLGVFMDVARSSGPVVGVVGGLHGFTELDLLEGLDLVAPGHCTRQLEPIASRFDRTCRVLAAGLEIDLAHLGGGP